MLAEKTADTFNYKECSNLIDGACLDNIAHATLAVKTLDPGHARLAENTDDAKKFNDSENGTETETAFDRINSTKSFTEMLFTNNSVPSDISE
jgi:hypothetical protein